MKLAYCQQFLRKSLYIVKTIAKKCGIHGIQHILNPNITRMERLMWTLLTSFAALGAIYISFVQFRRFQENPTVSILEKNYREWKGTVPAATVCYPATLDEDLTREFIYQKWNTTEDDEEYETYLEFISSAINMTMNSYAYMGQYSGEGNLDQMNLLEILDLIKQIKPSATTYDKQITLDIIPVMTEKGLCYSVNSLVTKIITTKTETNQLQDEPVLCSFWKSECLLELQLPVTNAEIAIHSPFETYSNELEVFQLQNYPEVIATFKVVETVSEETVKELTEHQRKCVFPDERFGNFPIYSKTLCQMKCRAYMSKSLCNCVPWFYPFSDGPFCTIEGIGCLEDFNWPIWSLNVCNCPNKCVQSEYSLFSLVRNIWKVEDDNIERQYKSNIHIIIVPPKTRIKRTVVFTYEDLLVSLGSTFALFLGFSLWAVPTAVYVILNNAVNQFIKFYIRKYKPNDKKSASRTKIKL